MVARQWGPGDSLYGDYWVDRPPLLIALVALSDLAGGAWGLRLMGVMAAAATVLLAGWLGRTVSPDRANAPILPAAVAAVLVATPLMGGSVVSAELLGLPWLLAGLGAIVRAGSSTGRMAWWWGLVGGVCGMAAFLVKQNLIDVFVFLAAVAAVGLWRRTRTGVAGPGAAVAGAVIGAAAMLALGLAGSAAMGTGPYDLWSAIVTFRWDASHLLVDSPASGPRLQRLLLALLGTGVPLLAVVLLLGLARSGPHTDRDLDLRIPSVALIAWELVSVLMGGSYWAHYLSCLIPGLVLLAAVSNLPRSAPRVVAGTLGLVALSTVSVIAWVAVHPIDRPSPEISDYLADHAEPGDTAVVAFGVASILEEAGLESPYPDLWSLPVRVHDPMLQDFARLLDSSERPTWIVISGRGLASWGIDSTAARPLLAMYYERVAIIDGYRIFREV